MGSCVNTQSKLKTIDKALTTHNACEARVKGKVFEKSSSSIDEKSINSVKEMFKEIDSIYKHSFNVLPRLKIEKSSLYMRRQKFLPQKTEEVISKH